MSNSLVKRHGRHTYPKRRVLCLVSNAAQLEGIGFFAEEMTRPFFDFINAGYDVDVASPEGGAMVFDTHSNPENPGGAYPNDLISIGFVHHPEFGKWMQYTLPIADVNVANCDAICVAGGGAPLITFKDDLKLHQ